MPLTGAIHQAGLFSAILTAFNVESYKLLQVDEGDEVVAVLRGISAQLNSFSVSGTFVNATNPRPAVNSGSFVAPIYAVWVNSLWFCALVCTLSASSIAITVRQWLLNYEVGLSGTSRAMARLRQIRYEGLMKWRVAMFVATIPILLQISLMLFLAGLLVLLWSLHPVVATIASVTAGLLVVFTSISTLIPAFRPDCCYRSPQASLVFPLVQHTIRQLATILGYVYGCIYPRRTSRPASAWDNVRLFTAHGFQYLLLHTSWGWSSWEERDMVHAWGESSVLDIGLMRRVYEITWDDTLLSTVLIRCLNGIRPEVVFSACVRALQQQQTIPWHEFHRYCPISPSMDAVHPTVAVEYRTSQFHTHLLNHTLSIIPALSFTDDGRDLLRRLAPKIIHLLPPYMISHGDFVGTSLLYPKLVLHSLSVLVTVKDTPADAFRRLVALFGWQEQYGAVIKTLTANELSDSA